MHRPFLPSGFHFTSHRQICYVLPRYDEGKKLQVVRS